MKRGRTFVWITSIMFWLVTIVGSAKAQNGHRYNGSFCKAYAGYQEANLSHQSRGTYNISANTMGITCPVLVDEVGTTTGTYSTWVHWTARSAADTIFCALYSMNGNGSLRQSQFGSKTGTGWFSIPGLTSDDPSGSYWMLCSLPGYGIINTIALEEKN